MIERIAAAETPSVPIHADREGHEFLDATPSVVVTAGVPTSPKHYRCLTRT
jgi:hypothetical protein